MEKTSIILASFIGFSILLCLMYLVQLLNKNLNKYNKLLSDLLHEVKRNRRNFKRPIINMKVDRTGKDEEYEIEIVNASSFAALGVNLEIYDADFLIFSRRIGILEPSGKKFITANCDKKPSLFKVNYWGQEHHRKFITEFKNGTLYLPDLESN